jgi:hypothetical protein
MIAEANQTGGFVTIYQTFFDPSTSDQKRKENIIHESSHIVFGIQDYAYKWNRMIKYLSPTEKSNNPDSIVESINNTLGITSEQQPPGTAWSSDEITDEAVATQKATIAQVVDEAAAVLGDVLYYTRKSKEGTGVTIADTAPEGELQSHIRLALAKLEYFRGAFQTHPIVLKYNASAPQAFELAESSGGQYMVIYIRDKRGLERLPESSIAIKVRWLMLQLTRNIALNKAVSEHLKAQFEAQRRGMTIHAQGAYPAALLEWSQSTD